MIVTRDVRDAIADLHKRMGWPLDWATLMEQASVHVERERTGTLNDAYGRAKATGYPQTTRVRLRSKAHGGTAVVMDEVYVVHANGRARCMPYNHVSMNVGALRGFGSVASRRGGA